MIHTTRTGFPFELSPSGTTMHAVLRCAVCSATASAHATATGDTFVPDLDQLAAGLGFVLAAGGRAACGPGCKDRANSEKAR